MEWRAIPNYEEYHVSENGDVKRVANKRRNYMIGKCLKPKLNAYGYYVVSLMKDGKYYCVGVHRLVCMAFHGMPPSDDMQTCHNDGTRTNNHYSNLRWGTVKENAEDRGRHGNWKYQYGRIHHEAKLDEDKVAQMRILAGQGKAIVEIARMYGVHKVTAREAIQGITWKHVEQSAVESRKKWSRKSASV